MEIKSNQPVLIDEVYNFLNTYDIKSSAYIGLNKYEELTQDYLKENHTNIFTDKDKLKQSITKINSYSTLSKQDKFKLIEFKPATVIELSLLIEDYEDKLSEKEISEITSIFI